MQEEGVYEARVGQLEERPVRPPPQRWRRQRRQQRQQHDSDSTAAVAATAAAAAAQLTILRGGVPVHRIRRRLCFVQQLGVEDVELVALRLWRSAITPVSKYTR